MAASAQMQYDRQLNEEVNEFQLGNYQQQLEEAVALQAIFADDFR